MVANLFSSLFPNPEKRQEQKAKKLATETNLKFNDLLRTIKEGGNLIADRQKVMDDRQQFLQDNAENPVDQNVSKHADTNRAYMLLTGVMVIGCLLSVKGLKFFCGSFYASVSLIMIIPIAMALAGLIVVGSIYINNFSDRFKESNPRVFRHLKIAAYALVLFIPMMNFFEGLESNYRPVVMALNIFACIIDVGLHTALVSMSDVFVKAEDMKKSLSKLKIKDKAQQVADDKIRSYNEVYFKAKTDFSNTANQLVYEYKILDKMSPECAANVLYLLPNFERWVINNKIVQHPALPMETNSDGQLVVEEVYPIPENQSFSKAIDVFGAVNIPNSDQSLEAIPIENMPHETLPIEPSHESVGQEYPDERQPFPDHNTTDEVLPDYGTLVDDELINKNDKVL